MAHFRSVAFESRLVQKCLTVNLWGELSCEGAEGLCSVLAQCSLYSLTLNVHVELTDAVVDCIARCFTSLQTLCCVTFIIWGKLSLMGKTVLQRISDNNPTFLLYLQDLCNVPDESCSGVTCSFNVSSPFQDTEEDVLSLESDDCDDIDWTDFTSLTSLDFVINNFIINDDFSDWRCSSNRNDSLTEKPSVTIDKYSRDSDPFDPGRETDHLRRCLRENTSLRALTLTINNFENPGDNFKNEDDLWEALWKNKSLTTLTLTLNVYSGLNDKWLHCLVGGFAHSTSITTLNLTVNVCNEVSEDWLPKLCSILNQSDTLTTLRLHVSDHCATSGGHIYNFSKLKLECKSLSSLDLTVSFYGMKDSSSG